MGKKKRIARYPQKFGRKYSAHPAYRAAHGEQSAPEPIELEILSKPEPAPVPKVEEEPQRAPKADTKPEPVAKAEPPKEKQPAKRSVSRKLEKNEKSKG